MDEGLSRAVLTIFKRLYDDGLIYRDNRIINWCPRCLTALSDIEVDHADDDGELVSIRYGSVSPGGDPRNPREGENSIVVATTRAETMLGDTAVAVHPDDERYAHLVGTTVELPLTGRRIPVVADAHVDPAFGTGAVKVTPAHDPNDFEIGRRHDLEALTIMDERGVITAPGPFAGLDRFEARPAIVAALREEGRIVREIRPYPHAVGHCSRCGTTVEPRLSLQWFVRVAPLAKAAGDAVRDGRVRLSPPEMNARFFGWVDDMHDWCISRQLWWGHRIPVFYGPDGEVRCVGPDEAAPEGWTQDPDVLDTWFSSGLWPFSTLGWPDDTDDLRAFYPTSVLGTGYDILFFWVARMMMFGLYAMRGAPPADAVPFRVVALHGLVRDQYGKKMSKSRGNTVDPIDWMDRFGTDATRFTLARGATPGSDEAVSEDWAAGSRNFCNKLWNATRFALMNGAFSQDPTDLSVPAVDLPVTGRWILSRLSAVTAEVNGLLEDYEFGKACEALYHFAWDEFCDWYLELAKVPLAAGGAAAEATRGVLGFVLDQMLRLLHPVMPYLTDELWTALISASPRGDDSPSTPREGDRESVMVAAWPSFSYSDAAAEAELGSVQRLVTEVRRFRSDQGLKPGQKVAARLTGISGTALAAHEEAIRSLLRLTEPGDGFAASASLAAEGVTVQVDLAGTVDVAAERKRLEKDLAIARKEAAQVSAKLGNEGFMAKAPQDVVVKTRERLAVAEADISRLESRLATLG
jgi:valyl-tRNA synthetase